MSVIGIVSEFNPFHNGHKYLIDSVKGKDDILVAVMSGNFVQRGEPALFPKDIRTKIALQSGVDIVLELPFLYATASAERFASSAVKILSSFGCEKIAFGSEEGNISQIEKTADVLLEEGFDEKIKNYLDSGVSYPNARQRAFNEYGVSFDISLPNNILALEYVKAIKTENLPLKPITVSRLGTGYNDNFSVGNIASATHIRNLINDNKDFETFVTDDSYGIYKQALSDGKYVSNDKFNLAAMAILRSRLNENLSDYANMAEGLENRIKDAIRKSVTVNELYDCAKTKRYTHSRIRRSVLSLIIGVKNTDLKIDVPYYRLLGFNKNVSKTMGISAKESQIPFVVNYSDIQNLNSAEADRVFELENQSANFYNLILKNSTDGSTEMTASPIKTTALQENLQNA